MAMASSATTKAARRAAREAVVAAQADLARRTRANMDDLAVFLSARQRADAVDDWFNERVAALKAQADERRAGQRRECGVALAAMRERGESIRDIARMAGIGEKTVRELIRAASTGDAGSSASDEAMLAVLNGHTGAQGGRGRPNRRASRRLLGAAMGRAPGCRLGVRSDENGRGRARRPPSDLAG